MADDLTAALAEIRERAGKATPGPRETTERHGRGFDDEGWSELTVKSADALVAMTYWTDALETEKPEADGAFIAHAREDVPRLLAALDAARERWDDLYSRIQSAATSATATGNGERQRAMLDVLIMMDQSAGKEN